MRRRKFLLLFLCADVRLASYSKTRMGRSFGKPGSMYDFEGQKMDQIKKECLELQKQQDSMRKKINPKVINMIDR
jgi:hypothetical protein